MCSGDESTCAGVYEVATGLQVYHVMHARVLICQGGCSVNVRSIETALIHTGTHSIITYPRISSRRRSIHRDIESDLRQLLGLKAKQVHQVQRQGVSY
jgi:hypothetical protein